MISTRCTPPRLKIHPLSQHVLQTAPRRSKITTRQTAGKAGSPGEMLFEVRSKGRQVVVAGREPAGVVKSWASGWWEGRGGQTKMAFLERRIQQPMEVSRENCQKCLWSRIRPRRWNAVLQEAYKCDVQNCGNQHTQFKTTQLLFEVLHDDQGGRTRAVCFGCRE